MINLSHHNPWKKHHLTYERTYWKYHNITILLWNVLSCFFFLVDCQCWSRSCWEITCICIGTVRMLICYSFYTFDFFVFKLCIFYIFTIQFSSYNLGEVIWSIQSVANLFVISNTCVTLCVTRILAKYSAIAEIETSLNLLLRQ